ncbi:hypothetical protein [Ponticoccus alexandrii]|uniref:Uncharacterized protein n=1 Tax=Ponticoccus alexandrii TaxID=1943633 RepID=A0ABX7F5P8_9RHOB|nr:hypothetical protein [Ponticoccus alexandrii]ETA53331.1 hypothetical protein P279_03865 [Rhodobacteraceae bacterium PD-2]QRF65856.1 hypothetical protein GQA70_05745 [Ponticoccus alexandrii]
MPRLLNSAPGLPGAPDAAIATGPDHVLPATSAARDTVGRFGHKLPKTVTWQDARTEALPALARASAIISRAKGMTSQPLADGTRLDAPAPPRPPGA